MEILTRRIGKVVLAAFVSSAAVAATPPVGRAGGLGDLSLEQLTRVVVSSASGRAEPLSRALTSIFVISGEDIRRAGVTTLPEALRLAPNLEVARTGTNGYAITARGFNGTLANKLLVLIDGRSIYTPTFSGVFWDAQDVLLEDVDRIEVISGPGGVLWGANAVNGVINILTKSVAETTGGIAAVEGGNTEARLEARYGDKQGRYRVYGQASRLDDSTLPDGTENVDGTDRAQAGFRADWDGGTDRYTLQGDFYAAEDSRDPDPRKLRGANLLARWNKALAGGSDLRVQAYYDFSSREQQHLDIADVELAHALSPHGRHTLLWGAGARYAADRIDNTNPGVALLPADKSLTSWNAYLQDVMALGDRFDATAGLRVDRTEYTGIELLPSVRFGWRPGNDNLFWAAASRAVREPARIDHDLFIPGTAPFLLAGGPDFQSEISYVYELGYRGQPHERLSWSATVYYQDLQDQRSISPAGTVAVVTNDLEGRSRGFETWAAFRATDRWRLQAGYSYFGRKMTVRAGAIDLQDPTGIGSDPKQWASLRSSLDVGDAVELDVLVRFVDRLDNLAVPSYTAVDARLGWTVSRHVELSLMAQNLLDSGHVEWSPGAELPRAGFVKALIRF